MTVLGIDIGGTKVLAALVSGPEALDERRMATDIAAGPAALVAAVARLVAPWSGRFGAVGAAVSGLVRDGRWRALNTATIDLPEPFALEAALARALGAPAVCVNDAQAAAWAEHAYGAGRGRDMVFVTVSTGIGGGIVLDGRLRAGLAGHFGQFVDDAGGRIEDRAAGRWLAAEAAALGHPADAAAVFARLPEPWAEALVAASAARVAALLRNVQLALDPEIVVVGGGIGLAPGYLARLEAAVRRLDPALAPRLAPAALGERAGVVGAAALAHAFAAARPQTHREIAP